jgi:hypothetical protein
LQLRAGCVLRLRPVLGRALAPCSVSRGLALRAAAPDLRAALREGNGSS